MSIPTLQAVSKSSPCWFVGAAFGDDDQLDRFLEQGIWENGYTDQYLDEVRSIKPGDRIAIKSSYTRKKKLPFDNRDQSVSVMAIKAIGTVKENLGDGRHLKVDWLPITPFREWYFYTNRSTIWRVEPGEWENDGLISFSFNGEDQDYQRFQNAPYWRERYGEKDPGTRQFLWTKFYQAIADKLLAFKDNRAPLIEEIHAIAKRVDGLSNLEDKYKDNTSGPLRDICPFTVFSTFNRGITVTNRRKIAAELASFLHVDEGVPESYEGVPFANNQRSWFFDYEINRKSEDIDVLWRIFSEALKLADTEGTNPKEFAQLYDQTSAQLGVGWNLSMGFYWIRPWAFPTLDGASKDYISGKLKIDLGYNGPKGRCSGDDYLRITNTLLARFKENAYPVHSFPELSYAAYNSGDAETPSSDKPSVVTSPENVAPADLDPQGQKPVAVSYTVEDILSDGCFLEREVLDRMLDTVRRKKNLILQGPPGTGKTWLAKKLAYALTGQRNDSRVLPFQFHVSMSYEDFVRGWRPGGDGKLSLDDGPFLKLIDAATKSASSKYVMVIEEINRGNPAQIFGEMLTLIENNKRGPHEAMALCYRRSDQERIYVPDNLYLIGTMNIADRSLALVDMALRRRFAFFDLKPLFNERWRNWVHKRNNVSLENLKKVEEKIVALNEVLSSDSNLGVQFCIGHSFLVPPSEDPITNVREWFEQIVETEIRPLLLEYWFDSPKSAHDAAAKLLEGF
ncbi:AAA family ATPase [Oscillatoria laete-virens NRMC-F 0139]|nr:AAA family ATPase [Oscillatoria laete-virens]MDL5052165.1 AAA family ATPase [Oscillatoria laete-virens NRMC-F 0139]